MRTGMINDGFVEVSSKLVFNFSLPALLFISISKTRFDKIANFEVVVYALLATLLAYVVLELIARMLVPDRRNQGVFVQGGFRSNMGIIGLAYCANAYGDMGLASASLYMGIITMLYNILAVITLSRGVEQPQGWRTMLVNIIKNPLIISIVLAWMVSWFQLRPPQLLIHTGQYFANLSLPLALLCAGATLSFKALRQDISTTLLASACKILFVPLGFVAGGLLLGFRGMDIGIILLMASAPTASASYVMARTMGANAQLAANIIVVTTLGSVITTSAAIMMLKSAGVM